MAGYRVFPVKPNTLVAKAFAVRWYVEVFVRTMFNGQLLVVFIFFISCSSFFGCTIKMASIRPLTDDMEYYHRAFGVYDRVADRHNVLINWMETQLKEVVKTMGDVTGPMRALCIGPGDGKIVTMNFRCHFKSYVMFVHTHCKR